MKNFLPLSVALALAWLPSVEAAFGADAARIVLSPDAYVGKTVALAVKFTRIESKREAWEKQAHLNANLKIKFTAVPLNEIKCYADRTQRNLEALTGLKKGKMLILTGALRRYRMNVKTYYHTDRGVKVKRQEKGRIRTRYAFIVDTIMRAG